MGIQLTHVTLGVSDLKRSTKFYTDLGCEMANDYGVSVFFKPGDGSSFFGLCGRDDLAADAGVDPKGSGFQGITLNYLVSTSKQVDELLAQAKGGGGKIVKEAHKPQWGGYLGYFSDLDGYLWKVAAAGEQQKS
jgi:catechol 2,3-dioxygenase-like lactoylglutathione lyase family enzyme